MESSDEIPDFRDRLMLYMCEGFQLGEAPADEIPDFRYRLIQNAGEGFLDGAAAGSAFYFARGLLAAPSGARLAAAARAALRDAPRLAGLVGACGAQICTFEAAASRARRREDACNTVAAGAASAALATVRRGPRAMALCALQVATAFALGSAAMWSIDVSFSRRTASRDALKSRRLLPPPAAVTPLWTANGDPALLLPLPSSTTCENKRCALSGFALDPSQCL
ncbi:hypothetical protein ACP4OV_005316 [Aristida adscensionis]